MALTLTRREGEGIVVTGPATIRIGRKLGRHQIQVTIEAPSGTQIVREEILDRYPEVAAVVKGGRAASKHPVLDQTPPTASQSLMRADEMRDQ